MSRRAADSKARGARQPATDDAQPTEDPAFTRPASAISHLPVAIVGLGLMGGSLALALKEQNPKHPIIGITRSHATLEKALAQGAIDTASDQLSAARDAGIVVLGAPVRTILQQIPQLAAVAQNGALILDLGSTKRAIVAAMDQLPDRLTAVGGHPMCGKELAGYDAAEATLYRNKVFVLCPSARTTPKAMELARALANAIGSRVVELGAAQHDRLVAAISHLPYLVALNLVGSVADFAQDDPLPWQLASSGFRDTSRLAASDVQMMLDILLTNSENVADLMRLYARRFAALADAVYEEDEQKLRALLEQSATRRRRWEHT